MVAISRLALRGWSWVGKYHEGQPTCRRRELAVSTDRLRMYHGRGHPVRLHPYRDHPIHAWTGLQFAAPGSMLQPPLTSITCSLTYYPGIPFLSKRDRVYDKTLTASLHPAHAATGDVAGSAMFAPHLFPAVSSVRATSRDTSTEAASWHYSFLRKETSPQWSGQRNFTHGVQSTRLSLKHGGSSPAAVQNVTLTYFLFTPLVATGGAAPPTKLPLLCFLHGYGDRPRPEALGVFTDAEHQKRLPLFVLRPGSTKSSNWASSLRPRSGSHISRVSKAQHVLLALLDRLLGELPVNPRLLVLAGVSMGAYATWDLLVRAPAVFAVGIPMSGGGDPQRAGRVTARVWAFHSRADQIVPVNGSRQIVGAVAAARNVGPNVGVAARGAGDVVGGALWATNGGHEGWTTDVAVGLRYTELQHASHNLCAAPLFDKGMAAPLFEWTLEQLRAAGFEGDRYSVA